MSSRASWLGAAVALAGLGGGCFEGTFVEGLPCDSSADCGPSVSCIDGLCGGPGEAACLAPAAVQLVNDAADHLEAGSEDHLVGSCGGEGQPEAVFWWAAPAAGRYAARLSLDRPFWVDAHPAPVVHVHQGACTGDEWACLPSGLGAAAFDVEAGEPVAIVVDDLRPEISYESFGFRLSIEDAGFCLDDDTQELPGDVPLVIPGRSSGEPDRLQAPICGRASGVGWAPDVVYRFRAPADGSYTFDTFAEGAALPTGSFDTVLYVLDGDCGGAILGCNDDASGSTTGSSVTVSLQADQNVLVVVDGSAPDQAGEFELHVSDAFECVRPEYDLGNFGEGSVTVPASAAETHNFGEGPRQAVALRVVAPTAGLYTFSVSGAQFLTPSVRRSCAPGAPTEGDADWALGPTAMPLPWAVPLSAGDERVVALTFEPMGPPDDSVTLERTVELCPADELPSQVPLERGGTSAGRPSGFRVDLPLGDCDLNQGAGRPDATHGFEAPAAGRYRFAVAPIGGADPILLALDTSCTGRVLACNDDAGAGPGATLELELAAGQRIVLVVDSAATGQDTPEPPTGFEYDLSVTRVQPP